MKNLTTASLMHCGVLRPGFWSLQGTTPGKSLHPFKPVFLICQVGAIMLPLDTGRPYWIVDKDLICFLVSLFVFKLNLPLHLEGCWGHLQTYWTHFWVTLLSPLGYEDLSQGNHARAKGIRARSRWSSLISVPSTSLAV